jgi:hypothetical protein
MKDKTGLFVVYEGESVNDAINEHYNGYTEEKYLFADVLVDLKEGASFSIYGKLQAAFEPTLIGNYQIVDGEVVRKN